MRTEQQPGSRAGAKQTDGSTPRPDASPADASRADASRADATRARLLEAAATAFAEKGFHGTTTRDIAAAAGMSPAAVYMHHRSKEELLHQLSKAGHESSLHRMREGIASTDDPVAALRRVVHDFAVGHAQGQTTARIVNYELAALTPEHRAEILAIRRATEDAMLGLVERGVAAGVFEVPDPRMATVALLSLGIDIARWYRDGRRWSPQDIAEQYAELALRIVGADRASTPEAPAAPPSAPPVVPPVVPPEG